MVSLAAALVGCGLIELGTRVFLSLREEPYARSEAVAGIRRLADQMTQREALAVDVRHQPTPAQDEDEDEDEDQAERERRARSRTILHPYLGYEIAYSFEMIERDLAHFRIPAAAATFDVLVLGGSVAANFGNEAGWNLPQLLAPLPAVGGREVRIYSYGRGSYKQPQQVMMLTWLLSLGFEPDLVINLDGFNEVAVANFNRSLEGHPLYPSIPQWSGLARAGITDPAVLDLAIPVRRMQVQALAKAREAEGSAWMYSALLGNLRYVQMRDLHAEWARSQRALLDRLLKSETDQFAVRGPAYTATKGALIQDCVRAWMDCVRMLHSLCESRGILFVSCLQPTLHDEGSKVLTADEVRTSKASEPWIEGVRLGYPLLRVGVKVLASEGISAVDASRAFADVEETLYYDACHFHRLGNRILSQRIVEALAAAPGAAAGVHRAANSGTGAAAPR